MTVSWRLSRLWERSVAATVEGAAATIVKVRIVAMLSRMRPRNFMNCPP